MAGLYSPALNGKAAVGVIAIAIAVFVVKNGELLRTASAVEAAPVLSRYCNQHRSTDLYVLGVDDEFYSAVLPLHGVRYGWTDPADLVANEHPHLRYLGILIHTDELAKLPDNLPLYRERLAAWGLNSTCAVATGISSRDAAELLEIVGGHPKSDFLVSRSIMPEPDRTTSHRVVFVNEDFALLESKSKVETEAPAWSCEM
jgi:hypothetical protein